MATRRLNLTRDQLAKFLTEHEQIRQFELLFAAVDELQTTDIDAVTYDAGAALAGVNKLAGVIAQLAEDGMIEASTALSVAEGVQRALAAVEHAAMMSVTTPDKCCEPTTAELMGAVVPPLVPKRRNAGAWHDISRQLAVGNNTPTRVQCDTIDIERGIWRDSATDIFYVADAGIYNVEFSAQIDRNKGTDSELWIWLAVDGADVPESASVIRVKGNDAETVAAWNFLVELKPGASISLMWATDDATDTYLETFPASGFHPAIPSVILTITQEA